jgi:DNA-directed RNA polymerase specialized sigma24 family protein
MAQNSYASTTEWNAAFVGYLQGDPLAAIDFYNLSNRYLIGIARRLAPNLADDQHAEVAQQAFLKAFAHGAKFDPERGSAKQFLRWCALNAVKEVQSQYRAPHELARPKREKHEDVAEQTARIDSQEVPNVIKVKDPSSEADFERVDKVVSAGSLCRRMPRHLRFAAEQLLAGESFADAAAAVGWTRSQLRQRLAQFGNRLAA